MGCDIHMVLERKSSDGWVGLHNFQGCRGRDGRSAYPVATERNYRLFAALAGVRGEGPAPKGLPEDMSLLTKHLSSDWDGDGHSHSWIGLPEAVVEFNQRRYPEGETPVDPGSYRDKYPSSYWFDVESDDVPEHRLVFWFDN